ncbi:MAG TPA: HEAT repeat domain-containing protein [Verrucomicrobiae bacterium]|nr:HEAT repeat domain-containing protein [Verrucomicrobiae bacterium]
MLAVILGVLILQTWDRRRAKEPIYKGKPLSQWLTVSGGQQSVVSGGISEVMQGVGTNAIPWLLHEASAHDPWPKTLFINVVRRQSLMKIPFVTASDRELRARLGLTALGPAGGLAVAQGLTNSDKWTRYGSVGQWEVGKMYPEIYLPALLDRLQDREPMIRARAANALGMVGLEPEKVVPALTKALDDPDEWVRNMAALGLSCYGPKAKSAMPALLKHLSNSNPDFQYFATNALRNMAPATTIKAGAQ